MASRKPSARLLKRSPDRREAADDPTFRASRLRAERVNLGVQQGELAAAVGISRRTLQHLESGDYENPPLRLLVSLAYSLGLSDWRVLIEEEWATPLPGTRLAVTAEQRRAAAAKVAHDVARYRERVSEREKARLRARPVDPNWEPMMAEVRAHHAAEKRAREQASDGDK